LIAQQIPNRSKKAAMLKEQMSKRLSRGWTSVRGLLRGFTATTLYPK